jgi:transposase InsO family protein
MMLRLQKFELEVVYKKGPLMFMADTLSRATLRQPNAEGPGETEEVMNMHDTRSATEREVEQIDMLQNLAVRETTLVQIKEHTEADSHLQALVRIVKEGWPSTQAEVSPELRVYHPFRDELTVQNGVIFKGERLIVPEGLRTEMKEKLHYNHGGVQATLRRAREVFYWPGMNKDIEDVIAKCNVCAQYRATNQKEPLMSSPVPTRPWESIATDLFELRNKDYLVTVDYYSNFIEVDRLYSKTSTEVIQKLKAHMARCGVPERVVSDNGPQYSSSEFQDFAAQYEFEHVTSSPRYPQSNGKAESAVKTAKRIMMKALDAKADPYLAMLEHRNTPSEGMSTSPAQRLFGRRTRSTIPTSRKLLEPTCMHSTNQELQQAKTKQAYYYNKGSKKLPTLKVGDAVLMMPEKGKKSWRKGKVKAIASPRSYIVATDDGGNYRRHRRHLRKTVEPDELDADIELPMEEHDLPDRQQLPECEEPVAHEPEEHAAPNGTRRTSNRQTRRPVYLEDYVTES